jgi:hypothetical protein
MRKYDLASIFGFLMVVGMIILILIVPVVIAIVIFSLIEYIPQIQLHINTWKGLIFYGIIFGIAAFLFDIIVDNIVMLIQGPTKKLFEKITNVIIGIFSSFCFAWLFAIVTKTISGSLWGFVLLAMYLYVYTIIIDLLLEKIIKKGARNEKKG